MKQAYPLSAFLSEYSEKNDGNKYRPVAVGRYGIRTRESIYSKELAKDYSKNKLIHKNTLTVGMGSVQIDIGVLTDDITYSVSPAYHTYRVAGINAAYLRYCLECRNQDMFARFVKRGSRQGKTIDLKRWLTYEIPVYDAVRQAEIVDRLDRISALIEKRQEQLLQLDELVKSRFFELFGDPMTNPKGFPCYTVGEVIEFQGGSQPDKKYFEYEPTSDNIRLIQIRDYKSDKYITYIPRTMAKRFCTADDIMIGRYGPPIFQILKGIEGSFNVALMKATPRMGNREFVRQFLKQDCLLEYLEGLSKRTAGQDGIQMDKLKAYPFPFPPLVLQEQFATFVEQTDKSKLVVQQSLEKLETLKKSLMQQYFG